MSMHIVIVGAGGRMGREVIGAASEQPDVTVAGGFRQPGSLPESESWRLDPELSIPVATLDAASTNLLAGIDAVIDFSAPAGAVAAAGVCAEAGVPLVSGTTGLSAADLDQLHAAARRVPVFYARSMSLGIAALLALLPALAETLDGFDVEIIETHHRHKADAPSGTALALGEAIAAGQSASLDGRATFGREGISPRQPGEIGFHAVRAGGNPGEHQIIFASDGEEVRLGHRAFSRRAYALGALRAARFVAGRAPGLYGLADLARLATSASPVPAPAR